MPADVAAMTAVELKRRLDAGEPLVVLDVREDDERTLCAIPLPATATDLHIPMAQVPARLDEIRAASATGSMVVYCHFGIRSMATARWLAEQGVGGVYNLDGGIGAWSAWVDPSLPSY